MARDIEKLILASGSPRRKELMGNAGVNFEIITHEIDEQAVDGESPEQMVERLAKKKAESITSLYPDRVVFSADTIVVLEEADGSFRVFGKPADLSDARNMLNDLSGRTHFVITAFAIICQSRRIEVVRLVKTDVEFRKLDAAEIDDYCRTSEPYDKAGAYAIQGTAGIFVRAINGSFSNVIGLPICEVVSELKKLGFWGSGQLKS